MTAAATVPAPGNSSLELGIKALKDFLNAQLPDEKLLDRDERDECSIDIVRGMCGDESGMQLLLIPGRFGGVGGGAFDASEGKQQQKVHLRFDAKTMALVALVFARQAASRIAKQSLAWVVGAGGLPAIEAAPFEAALRFAAFRDAQAGLLADMDSAADAFGARGH